jgi:hypothetical protein
MINTTVIYVDSKYDKKITEAWRRTLVEMKDKLEARLMQELSGYGLGDSELAGSIEVEFYDYESELALIVGVNAEYAFYVEFGTGVVGSENPHPNPNWGYLESSKTFNGYDLNDHGYDGWNYIDSKTGKLGWTAGQVSRPFMYNTWKYARQSINNVYRKHARRLGL